MCALDRWVISASATDDMMGMGKWAESRQQEFWVAAESLAGALRHVFYDRLNGLLAEAGVEQ